MYDATLSRKIEEVGALTNPQEKLGIRQAQREAMEKFAAKASHDYGNGAFYRRLR